MAIWNSQIGTLQEDSDITIIDPSLDHVDEHEHYTYVPIITRLKQANHSSENRQPTNTQALQSSTHENNNSSSSVDNGRPDYIFVHHDPLEVAKQLEEILQFYIRDLKQESNSQLCCDKQLVTRVMDLIRPAYTNDQQKSKQLDQIVTEIGALHDKRHIEEKEKIEHLRLEVDRLNRTLFTDRADQTIRLDTSGMNSMFTILPQGSPSIDQEQWTEIEGDAKKLHELVESQRNQINEIASLLSQTATTSSTIKPTPSIPVSNKPEDVITKKPPGITVNTEAINDLLQKSTAARDSLSQQQKQRINTLPSDTTLINHSPGTSPSHSMNTLIDSLVTHTIVDKQDETPDQRQPTVEPKKPIVEQPHVSVDILLPERTTEDTKTVTKRTPSPVRQPQPEPPVVKKDPVPKRLPSPVRQPQPEPPVVKKDPVPKRLPSPVRQPQPRSPQPNPPAEPKKCPVCHYQFPSTIDDLEMYDHIDKCLFPTAVNTPPKDYECPNCKGKFSGYSDKDYLQHLTDCYNREF